MQHEKKTNVAKLAMISCEKGSPEFPVSYAPSALPLARAQGFMTAPKVTVLHAGNIAHLAENPYSVEAGHSAHRVHIDSLKSNPIRPTP
eukprot:g23305.t1